jgi:hypothetical protein
MLDPFDQSSLSGIYAGSRFSDGQAGERDAMADFADSALMGAMGIEAAERSAEMDRRYAKRSGGLRVKAAKRASRYRDQQVAAQRRAAEPSTGQKIASGIGTAASAIGAVSSVAGVAAAI